MHSHDHQALRHRQHPHDGSSEHHADGLTEVDVGCPPESSHSTTNAADKHHHARKGHPSSAAASAPLIPPSASPPTSSSSSTFCFQFLERYWRKPLLWAGLVAALVVFGLNERSVILDSLPIPHASLVAPPAQQYPPIKEKVSVVIMNHSRPRMIQESELLPTLLSHPNVDEILLLHSNPATKFEYPEHPKVRDINAVTGNRKWGLSLRFHYCATEAKNDWVLHVDDDMELATLTIDELLREFSHDTKRIVGHYGRGYSWWRAPLRNGYDTTTLYGPVEVVLTKLLIAEKSMCEAFVKHAPLVNDLLPESKPLWNGEDVFFSLVANHEYGIDKKWGQPVWRNYAMPQLAVWEAPAELADDAKDNVSGNLDRTSLWKGGLRAWLQAKKKAQEHAAYRGKLWSTAKQRLQALKKKKRNK